MKKLIPFAILLNACSSNINYNSDQYFIDTLLNDECEVQEQSQKSGSELACVKVNADDGTYTVDKSGCVSYYKDYEYNIKISKTNILVF